MKTRYNPIFLHNILPASMLLCLCQAANAADILWSGALTGTLDWNTGSNWTGGSYVNSTTDRGDLRADWASTPTINFSGSVTVNGIIFNDTGSSGDTTLTIGNGGTAANTLTLGGTSPSIDVQSTTLTISANLVGSSGFTKSSGGVLVLSGSNTAFAGSVIVSGGTLRFGSTSALNSGSLVQLNSGASLNVNNSNTIAGLNDNTGSGGSVTNSSGGGKVLTIGGSGSYSFNGSFSGNASGTKVGLAVSGTGTQSLGGDNTANIGYQSVTGSGTLVFGKQNSIFQGLSTGAVANPNNTANAGINVSPGGTVALGVGDSGSGYFDAAAISIFLDGTHMGLSSNSTGFRNNSILGFDTTNATGGTFSYSTALANIGTSTGIGFAKLGTGTLVLDANNTYGGVTQVRAGTLQLGSGGTSGSIGSSSDITVSSGATLAVNRSDTALVIANKISGAGGVSQNGTGTTTLTAPTSDYAGGTNINAGILVARVGSIGSGNVNLNSGGKQFKLSNSDFSISNNITIASGAAGVSGQGLIDTDTNVDAVLNGNVTISGSPTELGAGHFGSSSGGSLTVNGTITSSVAVEWRRNHGVFSNGGTGYSNFKIRSGDVKLGGNNGLATTSAVALGGDGSAILDLAGYNQSLAGITKGANAATITNNGTSDSTLTITGTSNYGGVIQDGPTNKVSLTVNGGSLTLGGISTYTGPTSVINGALIVDGNISTSITTVSTGSTLRGSGTVGSLTINSGAFLNPGNSPGALTVDGDYNQAGTLNIEITGLIAGSQHDQINVDRVSGDAAVSLSGSLLTAFSGGTYANGNLVFILLNDGTDAINGVFTGLSQDATVTTYGGFDWKISYTADSTGNTFTGGNDVALMAVPEPNAAALLGGLGMLALLRRKRHH